MWVCLLSRLPLFFMVVQDTMSHAITLGSRFCQTKTTAHVVFAFFSGLLTKGHAPKKNGRKSVGLAANLDEPRIISAFLRARATLSVYGYLLGGSQ